MRPTVVSKANSSRNAFHSHQPNKQNGSESSNMKISFNLAVALLLAGSAQAASFDCAKAQSRMERAICNSAQLSTLDDALTGAFQLAKGRLSPNAAKIFTAGQVSWLRFTSSYCFIDDNAALATHVQSSQCLLDAYTQRITEIESTGQMIANFKSFVVIDDAIKVTPSEQAVYTVQRSYIQLDLDTASTQKLNAYLAFKEKIKIEDTRGSESYTVSLKHPATDWMYKEIRTDNMTGPYPSTYQSCGLYSLRMSRPVLIGDVFAGDAWQRIAQSIAQYHFVALAKKEKDFTLDMVSGYEQFSLSAEKEFPYCFDKTGITVEGFLPHVVQVFDGVVIPWKSMSEGLTPYARQQLQEFSLSK